MPEPCPRGCGHPNQERHTCKPQPGDPEPQAAAALDERTNLAIDALFESARTSKTMAISAGESPSSNDFPENDLALALKSGRLVIIEASELAELRRKCAHYHAQRVEADEHNAKLEDALAAMEQAVRFALDCEEKNFPDEHCRVSAEHRSMLEANIARAKELLT